MEKNTAIEGIKREDFKNTIFFGSTGGKEETDKALGALTVLFPEKHIYIMDRDVFQKNISLFLEKHIKWKEQESLLEYTQKPENIQQARMTAINVVKAVGENAIWFTVKDLVDNTSMTYDQAKSAMELLFAFGLGAYRQNPEIPAQKQWRVIRDAKSKLEYLKDLRANLKKELSEFDKVIKAVEKEAKAEEAKQ